MVKRRRAKASTAAKTKDNEKDKAAKPTNSEETCSKNANICVDGSPSATKKPKLHHSSRSANAKKSQKYVPPFTASQRASNRLRNNRINSEKSEGKSRSQEPKVIKDLEGERHGNSQGKRKKETSAMILESNEEKTDEMSSNTLVHTNQSDVEMNIENMEENDSKRGRESIVSESISETSPKQSGVEIQSVESSTNKSEDKSAATTQEIGYQGGQEVLQRVPKLSDLAQQSHIQTETDRSKEEKTLVKSIIGESLKESMSSKLETNTVVVDGQMSDVTVLETTELDRNITIVGSGMSDVGPRISIVEARISDFDARLSEVGARIRDVIGLQALAETCANEEYIDVVSVEEEPSRSESSQRGSQHKLQNATERETKRVHEEAEDNINDNNQHDMAEEKIPNAILEQQQQQQDAMADVNMSSQSQPTTLCEEGTMDQLVNLMIPSSNESDDKKTQNNEPTNNTSLSSQEIIEDKLSEMLSIVSENEWNGLSLSQTKSESNTNASPITKNANKSFDDPVKISDTVTEIMSIESESDKCESVGAQNKCMEERVSNSLVNSDKNSQNTAKTEHIEIEQCEGMSVDNEYCPTITEKVEDNENKQVSACVNSDKISQKATTTETFDIAGSKDLSSQERVGDFISKRMDEQMASDKEVHENDQEVPNKVATSPEQEVPEKMVTSPPSCELKDISVILKKKAGTVNHDEVASSLCENSTTNISHDESKRVKTTVETVDVTTSNNTIDEQSYTEEFKALEELLPTDDMGLFDDVLLSKPGSVSVNNELPSGDGTIEFLINELNSLHCMVANYERAVEDMKRQYKSNGRF